MKNGEIRRWWRTHYSVEISPELSDEEVIVTGWVKEIRDLGGIRFIVLQDKEGTVQVTFPKKGVDEQILEQSNSLQRQYCISVKGIVKKMDKAPGGAEIIPRAIKILGVAKQPLPLDITGRTPADIDVRLDARVLDLSRDENRAIFKVRHATLEAGRSFLARNGFLEVNTPKIIARMLESGNSRAGVGTD